MSTRLSVVIRAALFAVVLTPVSAYAQQPAPKPAAQPSAQQGAPTFGLVASTASAVGFMWNYTDRLAFRPEFGWSTASNTSSANTNTNDNTVVSPGIAVLFYTEKWDAVKAYVSPRYAFNHTTSSSTTAAGTTSSTTNTNNITGSVGAEYQAHRHFAAFGEVGLNYAHSSNTNTVNTVVAKTNNWGLRSAVGAIFYF